MYPIFMENLSRGMLFHSKLNYCSKLKQYTHLEIKVWGILLNTKMEHPEKKNTEKLLERHVARAYPAVPFEPDAPLDLNLQIAEI